MRIGMLLCLSALLAPCSLAAAAEVEKPDTGCRAAPAQPNAQGNAAPNEKSLSETMDNCNGVLKPPAVGDKDMTIPAPDQGKTPVIKPEQIPPQKSK